MYLLWIPNMQGLENIIEVLDNMNTIYIISAFLLGIIIGRFLMKRKIEKVYNEQIDSYRAYRDALEKDPQNKARLQ